MEIIILHVEVEVLKVSGLPQLECGRFSKKMEIATTQDSRLNQAVGTVLAKLCCQCWDWWNGAGFDAFRLFWSYLAPLGRKSDRLGKLRQPDSTFC